MQVCIYVYKKNLKFSNFIRQSVTKGKISTQTTQRDRLFIYISLFDNLCWILWKMVSSTGPHHHKIPESLHFQLNKRSFDDALDM